MPKPLQDAIGGAFRPLSLDTREAWPRWASERGYSESQITTLMRAVARLTRHPSCLEALSSDLSERVDVGGKAIERVRPEDRLAATMLMLQTTFRSAGKANASKTPAPAPPPKAPGPAPAVPRRPSYHAQGG
jgi:hypothetical protein